MTKPGKLYQQLIQSASRGISFRDFERLLRAFGFELDRTVGSHRHTCIPKCRAPSRFSRLERTRSGIRFASSLNLWSAMAYI